MVSDGRPWWQLPNGWADVGVTTPMRRCGYCREDIHNRLSDDGVCMACRKQHPKPVRKERAA